jgi:hypothetical protein
MKLVRQHWFALATACAITLAAGALGMWTLITVK